MQNHLHCLTNLITLSRKVKLISMYIPRKKIHETWNNFACVLNSFDLSCEFIVCTFKCLAYFTFKIGMPSLNMYEMYKCTKRYEEIASTILSKPERKKCGLSFCDIHVDWNRIGVDKPSSDLGTHIINRMCSRGSKNLAWS